jgi:TonB family protein
MNINLKLKKMTIALAIVLSTTQLFSQKLNKEKSENNPKKQFEYNQCIWNLKEIIAMIQAVSSSSENESTLNRIAYFPNMKNYVTTNLIYPQDAKEYGIEGVVKAEIEINEMGEITASKVIEKLGFGCDEAVLKLLNKMPRWKPRLVNGEPRVQKLIVPVKFYLY